jgi:hypothetical protein
MRLSMIAFAALALLNSLFPQTDQTAPRNLPTGVLKQLVHEEREYCEDQYGDRFKKGCAKEFGAHLRWRELSITSTGESAILVENDNLGFCGSGGCALYLFIQKGVTFTQVLGADGGLGTLERVTVLKRISNGHYDIRVVWSDGKTHSLYQWDGWHYSTDDRDIWGPKSNLPVTEFHEVTNCGKKIDRKYAVCRGAWSGKTVALFNTWMAPDTNPGRRLDSPSPDGKKIIQVRGFHVRLSVNGKRYWTPFGNMHDAEVGWAPDSTRLFVTWSESGQLGPWHTQVYDVTETGLVEIPGVTRYVRADLILRMKRAPLPKWVANREERAMWSTLGYCADDAVGSQWLNGSGEILLAGLAGPDSECKYMGDFVVYRIEVVTGRILQRYSEYDALHTFGYENLPRVEADDDDL